MARRPGGLANDRAYRVASELLSTKLNVAAQLGAPPFWHSRDFLELSLLLLLLLLLLSCLHRKPRSGGVFKSEAGRSGSSNGTLDSPVGSFDRAVRRLAAKPRSAADAETRLHGLVFGSVFPGRPDEHGADDRQRYKDHDERDDSGSAGHSRECRTDVQAGRAGRLLNTLSRTACRLMDRTRR